MEKLFIKATRSKWRFQTTRGHISVEELWDLPLKSRINFDLDTVAKTINKQVKETEEESFITTTAKDTEPKEKLELVKYVISVKLQEAKDKQDAQAKAERKQQILKLLAEKEVEGLKAKSKEELLKELEELN